MNYLVSVSIAWSSKHHNGAYAYVINSDERTTVKRRALFCPDCRRRSELIARCLSDAIQSVGRGDQLLFKFRSKRMVDILTGMRDTIASDKEHYLGARRVSSQRGVVCSFKAIGRGVNGTSTDKYCYSIAHRTLDAANTPLPWE